MKKTVSIFLILSIFANVSYGACDWSTGITPGPNETFIYSKACHLAVGKMVQDEKIHLVQIDNLTKALQLKDLALTNSDARTQLWMTTAQNEQDRMAKLSSDQSLDHAGYFGLGVLTTVLAVFAAGQLRPR